MVFSTTMITAFIVNAIGKPGLIIGFILAFIMEFINIVLLSSFIKRNEKKMEEKYQNTIDALKEKVFEYDEMIKNYKNFLGTRQPPGVSGTDKSSKN